MAPGTGPAPAEDITTLSAVLSSLFCVVAAGSLITAHLDTRPPTRPLTAGLTPNAGERRARRQARRRRSTPAPQPVAVTLLLSPPPLAPSHG